MIAAASGFDLDDADRIVRADGRGVLRSAASAGAQCRAVAVAVAEGALGAVAGLRPRAVVLVARRGPAGSAADIVTAVLAAGADVPVVQATDLPEWAGSLDLVVVLGDDAGDPALAAAVAEAVRRGAETVVTAPAEGPVAEAAGSRALLLPPRVAVHAAHRFIHHVAAAAAVLAVARPARSARWLGADDAAAGLSAVADQLDAEALADGPARESFRNPAKTLAAAMLGRDVVVAGDDAATAVLARRATTDMLATAGATASGVELVDVLAAPAAPVPVGAVDPIFHDEQLDGPAPGAPRRVFVLAAQADAGVVGRRMGALPDAELVLAADPGAEARGEAPAAAGPRPLLAQCVTLAVRWQMAAAYVALAAGAQAPGDTA